LAKRVKTIIITTTIATALVVCSFLWLVARQGISAKDYEHYLGVGSVEFDANGIPTVSADDWNTLLFRQGFVHASERMWQMESLRRFAKGELSELFGETALERDHQQHVLDISGVVDQSVALFGKEDREACDRYAAGVNMFIETFSWKWGLEFLILRHRPRAWTCADTISILVLMAEELTAGSRRDIIRTEWSQSVPEGWGDFIFPLSHPWNVPVVATKLEKSPMPIPPALPMSDVASVRVGEFFKGLGTPGSNSWVYRGRAGHYLANDPHLGTRVPQLWYAIRLRVSNENWAVGTSIAGMPGVVIGMNPHIAWGFTNTGEDVDDLIEEEISEDGKNYRDYDEAGQEIWRPIEVSEFLVNAKGKEIRGQRKRTSRGPIVREGLAEGKAYSRRWLNLSPAKLTLPTKALMGAKNWEEFNAAIDEFTVPSQNVIFMDRQGNMGYRTSGFGVQREHSGRRVVPWRKSKVSVLEDPSTRHRLFISRQESATANIATANQRIWIDEFGHDWSADDRAARIRKVLSTSSDWTFDDMQKLQLDTKSDFAKMLIKWIQTHSSEPVSQASQDILDRWQKWNGEIINDEIAFSYADKAEILLTNLILSKLLHERKPEKSPSMKYSDYMRRAWLITYLDSQPMQTAVGLKPQDVADYLLNNLRALSKKSDHRYSEVNRWTAQHPFVSKIPLIGSIFRVKEFPQWGAAQVVRVELDNLAASSRMLWNMNQPQSSRWSFPIGQSGHPASVFFRDAQPKWHSQQYWPVFPEGLYCAKFGRCS
jgi:penicillin amidase